MPEGEPVNVEPPGELYENKRHGVVPDEGAERIERCIATLPRRLR